MMIIIIITATGLSAGGSGYFTCIQNMKLVGIRQRRVVIPYQRLGTICRSQLRRFSRNLVTEIQLNAA